MYRRWIPVGMVVVGLFIIATGAVQEPQSMSPQAATETVVALPPPLRDGETSVEEALWQRRSVRDFTEGSITVTHLAQLLWAAQGTNRGERRRTAPSAGALYPMEVYCVAGNVSGLDAGVYRYRCRTHELVKVADGDHRAPLAAAAGQRWIATAPATVVVAAVYERTARKYGDRARRYVHIEAGAVTENVYLQAGCLKLGTTCVGAFADEQVRQVCFMRPGERPLCILPIGHPQ
jgi:SagB-type dehydrogenase family enzyme